MPVMHIGSMAVRMRHLFMGMHMIMLPIHFKVVCMVVVTILMIMFMFMSHFGVDMIVDMLF